MLRSINWQPVPMMSGNNYNLSHKFVVTFQALLRESWLNDMTTVLSDQNFGTNTTQVEAALKKHEAIAADINSRVCLYTYYSNCFNSTSIICSVLFETLKLYPLTFFFVRLYVCVSELCTVCMCYKGLFFVIFRKIGSRHSAIWLTSYIRRIIMVGKK